MYYLCVLLLAWRHSAFMVEFLITKTRKGGSTKEGNKDSISGLTQGTMVRGILAPDPVSRAFLPAKACERGQECPKN